MAKPVDNSTCPNPKCGSDKVHEADLPRMVKAGEAVATQPGWTCDACGATWSNRRQWQMTH